MICIRCRLELFEDPDRTGEEKHWTDKSWGEWTCPTPTAVPGRVEHGITPHSPAYEISGALLDDIVDYLGAAAEMADRIDEEDAEQFAQLAEVTATEPKLVTP